MGIILQGVERIGIVVNGVFPETADVLGGAEGGRSPVGIALNNSVGIVFIASVKVIKIEAEDIFTVQG